MLVLAPFLGFLPQTVLAAIVIVYSVGLINPPEFVAISKIRRMEFTWAIAALLGVLVFGTLQGIVVAIVLSLIGLSGQAVNSKVYVIGRKRGADVLRPLKPENPDDETIDGLLILRPEGRLFFANAQSVGDQIRALVAEHQPRVVALDMSRVPDLEYSALQMLVEGERRMTEEGVTVWLAALNPSVLASMRASPLEERLGRERLLFNAREAIRKYQEGLAAGDAHSPTE
jgi:sulfate permease, SulP family